MQRVQRMQLAPNVDLRDFINLQLLQQDHYNHSSIRSIPAKKATARWSGRSGQSCLQLRHQQRWGRHGAKTCQRSPNIREKNSDRRSLCDLCFPAVILLKMVEMVEICWNYHITSRVVMWFVLDSMISRYITIIYDYHIFIILCLQQSKQRLLVLWLRWLKLARFCLAWVKMQSTGNLKGTREYHWNTIS